MPQPKARTEEETTPRDPVPIELFGNDHWSTFAYLECRTVDYKGAVDKAKMRTDADRHPSLRGFQQIVSPLPTQKYPTRLNNSVELDDHDDWDCFTDLEAAGLAEWIGTGLRPAVRLTDLGRVIAGQLRAWLAEKKPFRMFRPDLSSDHMVKARSVTSGDSNENG